MGISTSLKKKKILLHLYPAICHANKYGGQKKKKKILLVGAIHEVPFFLSRRTFSTVNGTARGMVL